VLGCDDGSYARPEGDTDGYLVAVFHPTEGETAEPFSALIAVRAGLEYSANQAVARQRELLFLILPGVELNIHDLLRGEKARDIVPLDKITNQLIAEFGKTRVEKYDAKKRLYLRRLYGALQGHKESVSEQEAMNSARAFSRFMAYKPVHSINKFVSDEILEKKDLGEAIRSISGQLKTIHAMERDAGRLVHSIKILQQAEQYGIAYINKWIELNTLDYTLAMYTHHVHQQDYLQAGKQRKKYRQEVEENTLETSEVKQRLAQIYEQRVQLEAQRQGISALNQKDELEKNLELKQRELIQSAQELMQQDIEQQSNIQQIEALSQALQTPELKQQLPQFTDLESITLIKDAMVHGQKGDINVQAILQKDLTKDLASLELHLDHVRQAQNHHNRCYQYWYQVDEGGSHFEQLSSEVHKVQNRYEKLNQQRKQKQDEIERLEQHHVSYPPYVQKAVDAIYQAYPQADPRVLCDHIEVKDEKWQMAIEGYLGGARFSIIVDEDYEAEAIQLIRKLPGRDNRAKIIQGSKARRDSERVRRPKNSLIHVLEFSHSTAMHYLTASYAAVLMVDSAEALKTTGRGITADGLASGNYSMFRCDLSDADLVFGAAARERALKAKQDELLTLTQDWQHLNDLMQQMGRVQNNVRALQPLTYAESLSATMIAQREIQKIEVLLSQLDLSEHQELEQKLLELKALEQTWQDNYTTLISRQTELTLNIESISHKINKLSELKEQAQELVEQCEKNLRDISMQWSDFDVDKKLNYADVESKQLNEKTTLNYIEEEKSHLHGLERQFSNEIQQHNEHCMPADSIIYDNYSGLYDQSLFVSICNTQKQLDKIYNRLKNNILVEKYEKLSQMKDSFNNAFVTHLCHTIHQTVASGKRQIELLNNELQHHKFGADQESFKFDSDWVPEYKEYANFFDAVIKLPTQGGENSLFDMPLDDKYVKVRDRLMAMLLDEDEHKALKELERIADYRNYRRYEIYKMVEGKAPIALSEYGTGSGGQLETPAYIIRSAAITSAFRFSEGVNHLRMVLVDEAFSKMDEPRSREVIKYLTETLKLQLIFIMPSSKSGPFMDLISNEFVFAKCPSENLRGQLNTRVLVDRKKCNQDKIQDLWKIHLKTEQVQAEMDFMKAFEDA